MKHKTQIVFNHIIKSELVLIYPQNKNIKYFLRKKKK